MNYISLNEVNIYQNENLILKNLSLNVSKGEFVYLVGKTGSGKSSLLKSLYGEISVKSGNLTVLNQSLIKIKKRKILSLRRKLGIIFQDFQLLPDRSIEDNIKFVMKATGWKGKTKIKDAIQELLQKVNMQDKATKFPYQLSGGEQQRVAIARSLVNNPDLILADEPTGNLDPQTSEEIISLLFEISQNGKTIVMATHDYDIINKFPSTTYRCENQTLNEVKTIK
ncbi:MAG: ATP-binding cassette domain-containing protein [Flavobacteriales bacterium]|jgi:cell division transport system ATP-binding protein|nr:ATP-binding cassette domain-containing protein [Flavobacteriales bacterium]